LCTDTVPYNCTEYKGGFSPLTGFMEETNYKSVVNDLKLTNGLIFGLPVVFDTDDVRVVPGAKVLLQYKNVPIAVFDVSTLTSVTLIKSSFLFG
jgi:sulfate adenylyltransferase